MACYLNSGRVKHGNSLLHCPLFFMPKEYLRHRNDKISAIHGGFIFDGIANFSRFICVKMSNLEGNKRRDNFLKELLSRNVYFVSFSGPNAMHPTTKLTGPQTKARSTFYYCAG